MSLTEVEDARNLAKYDTTGVKLERTYYVYVASLDDTLIQLGTS